MPHSSRVGLDRQDILPVVRETEGLEGFKVHVQIVEKFEIVDWVDRRIVVVFACFFLSLTTHLYHKPYHRVPVNVAPASA